MKQRVNFVDMDGTLGESFFVKYYIERPALLLEKLATVDPFPWTKEDSLFKENTAVYHIISGRFIHHVKVSKIWIKENFGVDVQMHPIGYTNYNDYVKDKARKLVEILLETINEFGKDIEIHLYEDSESVIKASIEEKNKVCGIPMVVHLVKDGELQEPYIA